MFLHSSGDEYRRLITAWVHEGKFRFLFYAALDNRREEGGMGETVIYCGLCYIACSVLWQFARKCPVHAFHWS